MSEFKVATYDQHLYLNESPLEGNEQTLASLHVEPNSLIYLRVSIFIYSDSDASVLTRLEVVYLFRVEIVS